MISLISAPASAKSLTALFGVADDILRVKMSDDADPQASDALAEQRVVVRYRLVRWRSADNEVGPFRADTIFAALRLIRLERDGVRFAADSLVEGNGFEPSVPGR